MRLLPSGLPEVVGDVEPIARFLTQSGHFSKHQQLVTPSVFLPGARDRETSVTRHGPEPRSVLQQIGILAAGARKLYGAAILEARDVRAAQLEVVSSEPPDRHAVIRSWPWNEGDQRLQKAEQLKRALQLARAAGAPLLFNDGHEWKPA